jgi:putative membrane protein
MRHTALLGYLTGLPLFAAYFALGLLLLAVFVAIYVRLTPYKEIALIRAGNAAAAASLGGAIIGFVLPVASSIENSVSLVDMLVWAIVSMVVQLFAFWIARALIPAIAKNVQDGQLASGVFLGAVAIALGLLNAACMTY